MEQKRIGIWIRVSTDFQVKDESPEHHEQRARYYAQSRDWYVVEVYRLDAVSGKSVMEHPEAQRMLKDIRSGHISGLVFSKLARLGRNTKELLEFAEIFRAHNADLISLAEQIDTSTPAGRLFFTIISAMAQWEREEISSRVAASVPIRAKMGKPLGGASSFGYKWENRQYVIDEQEAPVRRLLYEIFLDCQRKKTTAERLNELGYRTRSGARFSDTTVDRLLRDTSAKGMRIANYTKSVGENKQWLVKPKEEWVYIPCEPIIDEKIWNECNSILDEQQRSRKKISRRTDYLLAGILKCKCGQPMYIRSTVKNYRCKVCKFGISETEIDEIYQRHLQQYLGGIKPRIFMQEMEEELKKQHELLENAKRRRTQIGKKMDELLELRLSGEIDREHMARMYNPLVEQAAELDRSIPELEALIDYKGIQLKSSDCVLQEAKALYEEWENMAFSKKRSIVETVTEFLTASEESIEIAFAYLPTSAQTSQRNFMGSWRPLT
ncbi:recombinase family protein [uncultured Pedobacter sp.]|uniref:recombinase family protein n=1 Tax=uncultured Pedobacter sp. TaxID=246139 RepID=UPI00262753F4|nr:recombinase family protein [uncultured Pedobacter sp.]